MMTVSSHPLVHEYLSRLHATAVAALPKGQAEDLLADITEHLDTATDGGTADEATVRSAIDRLGSPDEVVAAALGSASGGVGIPPMSYAGPGTSGGLLTPAGSLAPPTQPTQPARPTHRIEQAALILLVAAELVALFLPLSAPLWVAGLVCLALATAWQGRDRVLAWAFVATGLPVFLGSLVGAGLLATMVSSVCTSTSVPGGGVAETTCTQNSGTPWVGVVVVVLALSYVVAQIATLRRLTRALH